MYTRKFPDKFIKKHLLICYSLISGCVLFIFLYIFSFDTRLILHIDSIIKSNNLFRGVVLIAKDNNIIYEKSYLNKNLRNQQFLVASITKQITSVLILKEVENGKLNLFEKANKYLKEEQKINDDITIHHLLSHTSGIASGQSIEFIPGTRYKYSNYGYIILGYILQNVTEKIFDDIAMELFQRVGMKDSFLINDVLVYNIKKRHNNFVLSLLLKNGKFLEISKTSKRNYALDFGRKIFFGNPAGGLISTAYDLNKWNYMLHNGGILTPKMYQCMISKIIKSNFPSGFYGYGICNPNDKEISHIGYVSGYKTTMSYFPRLKISLIILENISVGDYESDFKMHENIRKIILNAH